MKTLVLGPPGTGKTSRLLKTLDSEMKAGTPPERIAYVSFTRQAADEAARRAKEQYPDLEDSDFRFFRTLHSIAFAELGLSRSEVMGPGHFRELGELLNLSFSGADQREGTSDLLTTNPKNTGDLYMRILQLARAREVEVEEIWHRVQEVDPVDWWKLKLFVDTYEAYREDLMLWDFTDMLEQFRAHCFSLPLDAAIIDEAQDLSSLQWSMTDHALGEASRTYIAGDDDQAIYRWSGADIDRFLHIDADKVEKLDRSFRLPAEIWRLANGVSGQIQHRWPKPWEPRAEGGTVQQVIHLRHLLPAMAEGTWLVLVRNGYMANQLAREIRGAGYYYKLRGQPSVNQKDVRAILAWERLRQGERVGAETATLLLKYFHPGLDYPPGLEQIDAENALSLAELRDKFQFSPPDAYWYEVFSALSRERVEYYRACRRIGEDLQSPPRIEISTVHSVKGGEADNVVVKPDYTGRVEKGMRVFPDDESRVWYVAVTRARENLYLLLPSGRRAYPFRQLV